jgi:nucleoside-diphosphate-sugar epimerase
VLRLLQPRWRVLALTSSPERVPLLRQQGAVPLLGNLDEPATLGRLGGLADAVLHLAPPPPRRHGLAHARVGAALARGGRVQRLVYASTTGVYGDCQGERFDETRALNPATDRARRRVDAEAQLRWYGRRSGVRRGGAARAGHLRRRPPGGHPRDRLQRGTPALCRSDDVYTNHIHADDLARACVAALLRAGPQRIFHVCDDTEMLMGDYFDLAAELCGLPRPPRITRAQAEQQLSPMMMSFMSESRRLDNRRLKRELRLRCVTRPRAKACIAEQANAGASRRAVGAASSGSSGNRPPCRPGGRSARCCRR